MSQDAGTALRTKAGLIAIRNHFQMILEVLRTDQILDMCVEERLMKAYRATYMYRRSAVRQMRSARRMARKILEGR